MIDESKFNLVKKKWSKTSSWAVWAKAGDKPKSNIGDISVFDINKNPRLLKILNPNIVMVGLNGADRPNNLERSRGERPWGNFHDRSSCGQDFKIRYAFEGTKYWGAYMTDIINRRETKSEKVISYLKKNPHVIHENMLRFYEELEDIGAKNPLIIVFGGVAYNLIKANIDKKYNRLIKIMHYSNFIGQEEYKDKVLKVLEDNT